MPDEQRLEIIKDIEVKRNSKIIAYITGDRKPFGARIAEDAVRPIYDHLRAATFGDNKRIIDMFLYSTGGDVSVPWRIATMVREFCEEFNVIIPYKAHSAATLLSLAADNIVMGKKAELGPIDPTLVKATGGESALPLQEIAVEDVNAFLSFIKEKASINDQSALAQVVSALIGQISPLTLGNVNRQNSHIRLVARKLLTSRKEKINEGKISGIIETLTEKIYSHGHAIGRREAKDMGLPVVYPNESEEERIWELYLRYEEFLKINDNLYPEIELRERENIILENMPIAVIESASKLHVFRTNVDLRKTRQMPPSAQINVNLNLQLPAGISPAEIPQQAQQVLQQMIAQLSQAIPNIVQQELTRQSLVKGFEGRPLGGKWHEE
jgi:hypothetical protein